MTRPIFIPHISPTQYATFRSGLRADEQFPARYEDWRSRTNDFHASLKASGTPSVVVPVDWDKFLRYANRMGTKPSHALLTAYSIREGVFAERRKKSAA